MSVDDHGLEALKKSAEEENPPSKAEYRLKTRVVSSALPTGAATEATLIQVRDNLTDIEGYVDQLETYVDGLEALGTAGNALATSILGAVDGLEGFTDGLEGFLDGVEGLLTQIRDNEFSNTATITTVPGSASSVSILAANAARLGFKLYNDSAQACLIAYAATSSATAFTVRVGSNSFYEDLSPRYRGVVSGIWNVAVGNMRVTELTA